MYNLLQIDKSWQICFTWDEEKNKKYKFHCSFFQCGSFLMTLYLPNGVKKALGSTVSPTTEKNSTNPKVRLVVLQKKKKKRKKEKSDPLIDKGNIPKLIWSVLLITSTLWTMDQNF